MWRRLRFLVWKELLELRADPRLFGLLIAAPILQLTVLGYAVTTEVKHVPLVVVDENRSPVSRALIERFAASPFFAIVGDEIDVRRADAYLASGRAWIALVIPPRFGDVLAGGAPLSDAQVQVLADGTDANSSGVALAYATGVIGDFEAARGLAAGLAPGTAYEGRIRVWFNPELESKDFMVPGVLALLLLVVTANLASMGIVREREVGTLEQLHVTPLGRWELILGKLLPYAAIGLVDAALVILVAVLWFDVPLRGSVLLLFGACAVYLLCTLGLGLFVSTISSTQQQAMMTSMFFFLVPMIYLSGFIFPIENMPQPIQWLTVVIPLRYFLVIVRGVFLKGIGLDLLWPQLAALGAWGVVVLTLAAIRSRKRV